MRSDPLAPATARGLQVRERLINLAGGFLSEREVAENCRVHVNTVNEWRSAGRLLALPRADGELGYPGFQCQAGVLLNGLPLVLAALRTHDAWSQLAFFVSTRSDLNGESAIARLRAGDITAVLRAASMLGEQGAA